MAASVLAVDAVCMAMLAAAADMSDESTAAKRIDTAVNVVQQLALFDVPEDDTDHDLGNKPTKTSGGSFDRGERFIGRKVGWPVEGDYPRIRAGLSAAISGQHSSPEPEDKSDLESGSGRRSGRHRRVGGPVEDDLPRRRSGYVVGVADQGLSSQDYVLGGKPTRTSGRMFYRDERVLGRRGGGPMEDDLPRGRAGFSAAVSGHQFSPEPEDQSDLESGSGRRSGRLRRVGGPVEDDVPRRRSGYAVGVAGELPSAVVDEPPEGLSTVDRSSGRHRRGGGPEEDDLPRRRSSHSVSVGGERLPLEVDEQSERQSTIDRGSGHRRRGGGPEEDDLPRRRSGYSVDVDGQRLPSEADEQLERQSMMYRSSGRDRKGGGPVEDDLPRRRSSYSANVDGQRLPLEVAEQSERQPTIDRDSGRHRKGGGPEEDDLPRRRSGYSVVAAGQRLPSEVDEQFERQSMIDRSSGRRPWGPVEDDLPRRRTSYSAHVPGIELPSAVNEPSERRSAVNRSAWKHRRVGGPVEDDLPRRHFGYTDCSASNLGHHAGSTAPSVDGTESHGERGPERSSGIWGWKTGGPKEEGLPRRNSTYSVDASGDRTVVKALVRRWQNDSEASTGNHSHGGESLGSNQGPANWDDFHDAVPASEPAFARWMDATHKPVEIDLPRRRSSQFSLLQKGIGAEEARSARTWKSDEGRTVGAETDDAKTDRI
eukprot:g13745.t1